MAAADGGGEGGNGRITLAGDGAGGTADDRDPGGGRPAAETFVREHAERVDVRGGGDFAAVKLFGRGVAGRAHANGLAVDNGDGIGGGNGRCGEFFDEPEIDEDGGGGG